MEDEFESLNNESKINLATAYVDRKVIELEEEKRDKKIEGIPPAYDEDSGINLDVNVLNVWKWRLHHLEHGNLDKLDKNKIEEWARAEYERYKKELEETSAGDKNNQ